MKLKVFIITAFFYSFLILQASSDSAEIMSASEQGRSLSSSPQSSVLSSTSSSPLLLSDRSIQSLTPKQLQVIRARQIATVAAEPKKVEIGTFDVLLGQIDQIFIYQDSLYKGVGLRDFSEKYPEIINNFKADAQYSYALLGSTVDKVHAVLENNPTKREITLKKGLSGELTHYKIIGTTPSSFTDDFGIQQNDALFNINQAQRDVLNHVHEYIDNNHAQVRKNCTGLGLPNIASQEVWGPGCCDVQVHRSCFKQCQHNMVTSCINPFCKKTEDGKYCRTAWTPDFYKKALAAGPVVTKKRIRDAQCPVCIEPLKPTDGILTTMIGKISKNK